MNASRRIVDAPDVGAANQAAAGDPRVAMKTDDGFVAAFFSAPIANRLLRRIASSAVTPNQVTVFSILTKVFASALYATGWWPALVLGAALVQLSFVFDCLDGQLARHRGQTSGFGEWLDFMGDCLGDLVLIAGIAFGCAARANGGGSRAVSTGSRRRGRQRSDRRCSGASARFCSVTASVTC